MLLAEKDGNYCVSTEAETLDSFIAKDKVYSISHKARFTSFKHRSKVEFLKFFIV